MSGVSLQTDVATGRRPRTRRVLLFVGVFVVLVGVGGAVAFGWTGGRVGSTDTANKAPLAAQHSPATDAAPTPVAFDPDSGAILPDHRIVAYYAVPNAPATGPAYRPTTAMLTRLRSQGAAYEKLDPTHPVKLGIDLVVSVPDRYPGRDHNYSHHVDDATIQSYVDFCEAHDLLLFLDLNIGWADPLKELMSFSKYLKLPFVEVAIDPEWMFPRHNGIPGVNLSNVRASDLNPLIKAVAALPEEYKVPRKVLIIHQYRGDGDGKANPFDPKSSEIADKRNIVNDLRVDLVIHIDSVGGWAGDIALKKGQYQKWVAADMAKYGNFRYGGFKIFYKLESRHRLMTPAEVMSMNPAPMVITYGN
jgi:hypothetical protein